MFFDPPLKIIHPKQLCLQRTRQCRLAHQVDNAFQKRYGLDGVGIFGRTYFAGAAPLAQHVAVRQPLPVDLHIRQSCEHRRVC